MSSKKLYLCPLCYFGSETSIRLLSHVQIVHVGPNRDKCRKAEGTPKILTSFNQPSHITSSFLPNDPGNVTNLNVENNREVLNICPLCDFESEIGPCLIEHVRTVHLKEKLRKCERQHCDFSTFAITELQKHRNTHPDFGIAASTSESNVPAVPIQGVERKSSREEGMILSPTNKKVRSRRDAYDCDVCEYSTVNKERLRRHETTHSGKRAFKCTNCPYSAKRSDHLRHHHNSIHSELRPFKCKHCSYSVKRLDHLKRHELMHTGGNAYHCKHCEYSTLRKDKLLKHSRTHTKPGKIENN